jgi:tetratricopeptide (TPR) repeat protein
MRKFLRLGCIFIFLAGLAFGQTEKWLLAQTPVFTIVSAADEKETLEWAVKLEQFRRGLQHVTGVADETLLPATVVIFRNDKDFEPFKPRRPDGSHQEVGGYFLTNGDHGYLAFPREHEDESMQRLIFHEGTHWFLQPVAGERPAWLEEGLAEVFSTFEFKDGEIIFGQPLLHHILLLHHVSLQPVAELAATDRKSLPYNEDVRTSLFYAQSWLLAHYLMFSKESANAFRLGHCLRLYNQNVSPAQIFEQAFGCDYHEMDRRLSRYLDGGSFLIFKIRVKAEDFSRDITLRPASAADVAIAFGELMAGVGDDTQAKIYLDRAVVAAPGDPRVFEIMAQRALGDGNFDQAVSLYDQAAGAGSKNFRVWGFLADDCFRKAGLYDNLETADPAKTRKAADYYEQAIRLSPRYPYMYRQLALAMGTLVQFSQDDRNFLREGLMLVPDDGMIAVGLAAWEAKNGNADDGRRRLQTLLNSSQTLNPSAQACALWVLAQMDEADDQKQVRDLLQQGKASEAGAILDNLLNGPKPMPVAERAKLFVLQEKVGAYEILQRAQQLADSKQPELAKAVLNELLTDPSVDAGLRKQAQALMDKLK